MPSGRCSRAQCGVPKEMVRRGRSMNEKKASLTTMLPVVPLSLDPPLAQRLGSPATMDISTTVLARFVRLRIWVSHCIWVSRCIRIVAGRSFRFCDLRFSGAIRPIQRRHCRQRRAPRAKGPTLARRSEVVNRLHRGQNGEGREAGAGSRQISHLYSKQSVFHPELGESLPLTYRSRFAASRPARVRSHALDYIEIYKRLTSDSDDTVGDKVSVFRRAASTKRFQTS
jgi:hypothetical protein